MENNKIWLIEDIPDLLTFDFSFFLNYLVLQIVFKKKTDEY